MIRVQSVDSELMKRKSISSGGPVLIRGDLRRAWALPKSLEA